MTWKTKTKLTYIIPAAAALLLVLYYAALRPYVLKLRYKLLYTETIISCSQEFGIDPRLTAAVIFCESGFDPSARSRVGAVGLMQLMPATAAEAAEELGIEGYAEEMLLDPEINIRLGCYYLSQMYKEFGSVKNILSAYNAGPGRTRSWIKQYGVNENNELLYIPYPETEKYTARVASTQKIYGAIYPELNNDPERKQ